MKKLMLTMLLSGVLVQGLEGAAHGRQVKRPANGETGPRQSRRLRGMEPEFDDLRSGSRKRKDHPTEISQGPAQMQAVPAAVEAPSEPVEPVDVPSRRRFAEYSRVKIASCGKNVGFAFATAFLLGKDVKNLKSALGSATHDDFGLARAAAVKRIKIVRASFLIGKYGRGNVLFYPKDTDNSPEADDLSDALSCADVVRELIAQGANPLAADAEGRFPLDVARSRDLVEVVRALLDAMPDAERRAALVLNKSEDGLHCLYWAVCDVQFEIVKELLKAVPDDGQKVELMSTCDSHDGKTVIHQAVLSSIGFLSVEMLKALLDAVQNHDERDWLVMMPCKHGYTALHYACMRGNYEIAKMLLAAMSTDNQRTNLVMMTNGNGDTALYSAVCHIIHAEIPALLLRAVPQERRTELLLLPNRQGKTVLQRINEQLQLLSDEEKFLRGFYWQSERISAFDNVSLISDFLKAVVAADGVMPAAE